MPHITIEYTKGLEVKTTSSELVKEVYQGACDSELFNNDFLKVRAISYDSYQSGTTQNDFLHVTAKILIGRTTEQKQQLSAAILARLESLLGEVNPLTVTVEAVDIDKDSHAQFINGN